MTAALSYFTWLDGLALSMLIGLWVLTGYWVDHGFRGRASMHSTIRHYRYDWMRAMITRQPRIFDSAILAQLAQSASFFASACMIAIGGAVALMANTDQLSGFASDISAELAAPRIVWEIKVMTVLGFIVIAFLRFVWAVRLFNYCAVLMASVPNDPEDPKTEDTARRAAEINIAAARHFNSALRGVYYAIAALGWLIGGTGLVVTTLFATLTVMRREFYSHSRDVIGAGPPPR
ncbi:DUF599 domain-containing protein [Paracoccaceae bacterium GXU_MW_L88]